MTTRANHESSLRVRLAASALVIFACQLLAAASPACRTASGGGEAEAVSLHQAIEDRDGRAMLGFYESLARAERGLSPARIIHYGDSHVAADILTGALRGALQSCFGEAGAAFALAGRPWSWYSPAGGVTSQASAGWRVAGITQADLALDRRFGLAGVSLETDQAGEWFRLSADCSRFDIYLMKQPGGGAIDVRLDGVEYLKRFSTASNRFEAAYVQVEAAAGGFHSIEVRTTGAGKSRIFGVAVERGSTGVIYDALGINGARASRPLSWDWRILASNLERRDPDLIIIAYGSNEAGDADLDLYEYGRSFAALLDRFHEAAPRASLLVISPPDRAGQAGARWQTLRAMPGLVEAQRRAALRSGAAFWNLFQAMGGAGSIERWAARPQPLAQPDRVHLTKAGYRLVAAALYDELMRGYLERQMPSAGKGVSK